MFQNCYKLSGFSESFNVPSTCINLYKTFYSCSSLVSLPTNFNLKTDINPEIILESTFENCTSLTGLTNDFNFPNEVSTLKNLFKNCTSLTYIGSSLIFPAKVKTMHGLFNNCKSLTSCPSTSSNGTVTGLNLHLSNVKDISCLFKNCQKLKTLPDTFSLPSGITESYQVFENCYNLSLDISKTFPTVGFNDNCDFSECFKNCYHISGTAPDHLLWNSSKHHVGINCFSNCVRILNWTIIPKTWGGLGNIDYGDDWVSLKINIQTVPTTVKFKHIKPANNTNTFYINWNNPVWYPEKWIDFSDDKFYNWDDMHKEEYLTQSNLSNYIYSNIVSANNQLVTGNVTVSFINYFFSQNLLEYINDNQVIINGLTDFENTLSELVTKYSNFINLTSSPLTPDELAKLSGFLSLQNITVLKTFLHLSKELEHNIELIYGNPSADLINDPSGILNGIITRKYLGKQI